MDWERLGQAVVAARAKRGWSQRQLAARAGLSEQTIWRIENAAQRSYDPVSMVGVELALGWAHGSIEDVLAGRDPAEEADQALAALLAAWPGLSRQQRAAVSRLAQDLAAG